MLSCLTFMLRYGARVATSSCLGARPGTLKYGCVVAKLSEAIIRHRVGKVVVYVLGVATVVV